MELSSIVNSCEKLIHAQSYSFKELPNEISAIKLDFETFSCFIRCIEDSDEIELSNTDKFDGLIATNYSLLLQNCFGSKLRWAWMLVNNQGYYDGLRFEFDNSQIIELVVLASSIKQFSVNEL
ncbi:DUF6334 family protein [Pseudoalteromonas gelatinilytica]|uniref:Uncharacterized protein n=1 Tax=Pseudoalteromonas gelatinilytica TaxID=1703256 RepID=A0ABQ1TKW7_9GAMM|nr:DUF6334 family protein [Pseudoalteromonas profundi]GGE95465.1 hypothetical protein GCM10008027_20530 [Pseudoalteromonas profundi]